MADPITAALALNVRRSLVALRVAVEDLESSHSSAAIKLAVGECETLSRAVTALARRLGKVEDRTPKPRRSAPSRTSIGDVVDFLGRCDAMMEHGQCPLCGGALREPLRTPENPFL